MNDKETGERKYHFEGEEDLESPALIYYEDIIEENIKEAIAMAGSAERMWPHVKTYKTAAVVRMLMEQGVGRFKCATIAEAEMCAQCGAKDILVSYPLVGPAIRRFIRLQQYYTSSKFWAIGDNHEQISLLGLCAMKADFSVPFLIDVNSGMNRTGVAFEELEDFCTRAASFPGLTLKGFHCYDGHMGISNSGEREKAVLEETIKLAEIRAALEAKGLELPVLVLGGTPTFPFHVRNKDAFLSPGTFFIQDHGYEDKYKDLCFTPGAAILTRVISRPREDLFTLDLGYKAISPDHEDRGIIVDLSEAKPVGHSEEHWVFRMEGSCPDVGTILYVIPTHICPTSALYPGVSVVRGRKLVNYWEINARNRKIMI
jgi:D-serine deaminase-like pyridoxal phosphate-dependent protein